MREGELEPSFESYFAVVCPFFPLWRTNDFGGSHNVAGGFSTLVSSFFHTLQFAKDEEPFQSLLQTSVSL